jgi:hypothetical protein
MSIQRNVCQQNSVSLLKVVTGRQETVMQQQGVPTALKAPCNVVRMPPTCVEIWVVAVDLGDGINEGGQKSSAVRRLVCNDRFQFQADNTQEHYKQERYMTGPAPNGNST